MKLGSGIAVVQARLMPFGAQITSVKNGFKWWTNAYGHHTKDHIAIEGSGPVPM